MAISSAIVSKHKRAQALPRYNPRVVPFPVSWHWHALGMPSAGESVAGLLWEVKYKHTEMGNNLGKTCLPGTNTFNLQLLE